MNKVMINYVSTLVGILCQVVSLVHEYRQDKENRTKNVGVL
jgi:hypothetical protein